MAICFRPLRGPPHTDGDRFRLLADRSGSTPCEIRGIDEPTATVRDSAIGYN